MGTGRSNLILLTKRRPPFRLDKGYGNSPSFHHVFGLCNAPATFERLIEAVLRGLPWDICLVYLDDIIVHARSFDHLVHLRCVLERLREANLKLNPKKCALQLF